MKIILTGELHGGKSTVFNQVISEIPPESQFGFRTASVIETGKVRGHKLMKFSGESEVFAHIEFDKTLKFGEYGIKSEVFNNTGEYLRENLNPSQWLLIDELGVMEKSAYGFLEDLTKLVKLHKNLIFTIQKRALDFWLTHFGLDEFDALFIIKKNNRDEIPEKIKRMIAS
ncbi:MAG: hypothetical protein KKA84_15335 [Bacteroidetes bacterium]|nr:hypothetical protein [Bacteroidota bacterium]